MLHRADRVAVNLGDAFRIFEESEQCGRECSGLAGSPATMIAAGLVARIFGFTPELVSSMIYGARRFVRRLNELGIAHRYEEFPDNHTSVDYRMDESFAFLAHALTG
jgi:hypothetical protein